jgi:RNA polymerase sigma-70 factor (ECF subfamily)
MIGPSFEAVLDAAAGGDEAAFGILWRDLQPGLLRYLNAFAPGAAEDLASETWLRIVKGLGRFTGDERAFRGWVFTVARHRAVDRWRRRARRRDELVPADALAGLPAADVAAITGKRPGNVRVLTHRALRRLADRLSADTRVRGAV